LSLRAGAGGNDVVVVFYLGLSFLHLWLRCNQAQHFVLPESLGVVNALVEIILVDVNTIAFSHLSDFLEMLWLLLQVLVSEGGAQSVLVVFRRSLPIDFLWSGGCELLPRFRVSDEISHYSCHALMVACDSHPVLPFAENTCIWENVELLAELRKVEKLFNAVEVDVSRIVERICLSLGRVLLEAYTEFTLANSAEMVRAVGKATFVGELVGIAASAVGGNSLDPKLESRVLGTAVVMERVLPDILDDLAHRERVKRVELAMFGVLKQLVASVRVDGAPRSRSTLKRFIELCWVEVSDVVWAFVACFLHASNPSWRKWWCWSRRCHVILKCSDKVLLFLALQLFFKCRLELLFKGKVDSVYDSERGDWAAEVVEDGIEVLAFLRGVQPKESRVDWGDRNRLTPTLKLTDARG
jgi:hypothetical protein